MFDAEKARKRLEKDDQNWKDSKEPSIRRQQYKRMKNALEGFKPVFQFY